MHLLLTSQKVMVKPAYNALNSVGHTPGLCLLVHIDDVNSAVHLSAVTSPVKFTLPVRSDEHRFTPLDEDRL